MSLPDPSGNDESGKKEAPLNTVGLGKITVFNYPIEANLFAAICYLPLFPANIIPCVIGLNQPSDRPDFIRFNAIQSLILSGGFAIITWGMGTIGDILGMIPFIGPMIKMVLGIAGFVIIAAYVLLSLKLVVNSFLGQTMELPVIAKYARQYSKQ